jgi:23S rRNA pseudouridine1911/1915/1917 synthase
VAVSAPSILFEDTHLLVLSKPAGLLSQGERTGDANLVDWLREYLGRPYVGLVHRLDRNTSGAMVVAKRTKSANRLSEALREGKLEREYLAWVEGYVPRLGEPLRWEHLLEKDERTNRVRVLTPVRPGKAGTGKPAILTARPLQAGAWDGQPVSLLRLKLETGRSHQIRAQSSHEGFPLLGDRKYGAKLAGFPRVALHSWRIRFPHPMSGETLSFEAPLPEDMRGLLTQPLPSS